MNVSFEVEGWGLRTGDGRVRLFKCDSSGRVEIRRYIMLAMDDYDESEYFEWTRWSSGTRLYAHMIDILLPPVKTPEPCLTREAAVEYAANVFDMETPEKRSDQRSWFGNTDLAGEKITMTSERIFEGLKKMKFEDGSHFRLRSGLERRLQGQNLPMTSLMREQIKDEISGYLEELQFPLPVIERVRSEIDEIEAIS
jgi:hypothetical protein